MKQIPIYFINKIKKFYPTANQLIIPANEKIGWSKTQGMYKHFVTNYIYLRRETYFFTTSVFTFSL